MAIASLYRFISTCLFSCPPPPPFIHTYQNNRIWFVFMVCQVTWLVGLTQLSSTCTKSTSVCIWFVWLYFVWDFSIYYSCKFCFNWKLMRTSGVIILATERLETATVCQVSLLYCHWHLKWYRILCIGSGSLTCFLFCMTIPLISCFMHGIRIPYMCPVWYVQPSDMHRVLCIGSGSLTCVPFDMPTPLSMHGIRIPYLCPVV